MKKAAKVVRTKICKIEDPAERIAETARLLAWSSTASPYKKRPPSLYNKVKEEISFTGNAKSCSGYVGVVLEASGLAPGILKKGYNTACIDDYLKNPKSGWKNIKQLKNKKPRSGDVAVSPKPCGCKCNNPGPGHTLIYLKNKSGKLVIAEANLNVYYGAIKSGIGNYHRSSNFKIYRYVSG